MQKSTEGMTILLAEDDEDDYLLTLEALKEAGVTCEVAWVKDGEELLDYLSHCNGVDKNSKRPTPDLVLLDLNMPKKDGRSALREIKADHRLHLIPIIILTTSKADADIQYIYQMGASSFVQKPTRFHHFVDVIRILSRYWLQVVKLPS